jgi:hypothetical protein
MSRFLAPIHSWLFNKIKMHEALEESTLIAYKNMYDGNVDSIMNSAYERYGLPLENKPLEELIDTSNIHGWLQNRIEITETRQSFILTSILSKYGEDAKETALKVYSAHGAEGGKAAADKFDVTEPPQIYQALNNYILDGMPCDNVNNVNFKSSEKLVWKNSQCLHKGYWESTGADLDFFYELRYVWIKNFIENANEKFTFKESKEDMNDTEVFVHEIVKK